MKSLTIVRLALEKIETFFLVLFLSIMVVFAFAQVVMRNAFGMGFLWGDPLVRQMVMWTGFVGAALAAGQERHISIDALTKFLPERVKHIAAVVTNAFGAVVCYYLGSGAWRFMLDEMKNGDELFLSIPSWVGLAIIPVGYWFIGLHFFLNILHHLRGSVVRQTPEAIEEEVR